MNRSSLNATTITKETYYDHLNTLFTWLPIVAKYEITIQPMIVFIIVSKERFFELVCRYIYLLNSRCHGPFAAWFNIIA